MPETKFETKKTTQGNACITDLFNVFLGLKVCVCVCVCVLGWNPPNPHGDYCPVYNYHDLFVNIPFSVHFISF